MASAFRIAERRQRITSEDTPIYLDSLKVLMIDHHHPDPQKIVEISKVTGLSIYDSAYIALCLKEQLPLATLDKKMKVVAEQLGIKVLS
jgi:predicted nucleic acid-binding protein